jgi:hypothetical protein
MEVKMRDEKGRFVKGFSTGFEDNLKLGHGWNKGTNFIHSGSFKKGHEVSEEIREKLRQSNLGENHPMYGKSHSEETRRKMRISSSKENNSNWNGGKAKARGYIRLLKPEHPYNNGGYVLEHRLVMEQFLNRYLLPKEVVHHINEIKNDNRIENLMLFENDSKHKIYHNQLKRLAT